jgi:glutamate carboxypeptidase
VSIESALVRAWPGMDTRAETAGALEQAATRLGRPLVASERGGASDASHIAQAVPLTLDGLGPRGGGAHTPNEWVSAAALRSRAEVALAVVSTLLD